ncbi:MAG TPA: zf-HC2 domain-containing protein [Vicinamibacterales bacterium]|nr:zf-HC2 domain-containing protein [Vicinamibacterales bacterium]
MSECRELEPLLAPYVDGEAGDTDCSRIEAHVDACPCCRGRLAAQRAACDSLRTRRAALRPCAPGALRARCAAHASASRRARAVPIGRRGALAAAAMLVLATGGFFALGLDDRAQALALQATIDHAKCARFGASAGSDDPATAAQRWQARFGWPLRVPASAPEAGGLHLRGVRRCAVTDGRIAHIMYEWQGEPLSVYVLPARLAEESPTIIRRFGHEAVMWSQNGRTYVLVSEGRRDPALDTVVAYVRATAY